jgi:hypothetical protein
MHTHWLPQILLVAAATPLLAQTQFVARPSPTLTASTPSPARFTAYFAVTVQ